MNKCKGIKNINYKIKGVFTMGNELYNNTIILNKLCKAITNNYRNCAQTSLVNDEVISPTGMAILTSLYVNPSDDTISNIATNIYVSKGLVSREVEKLRKDGYLQTVSDENDRRMVRLKLVDSTIPLVQKEMETLDVLTDKVTEDISDEDFQKFLEIVEKIQNNLNHLAYSDTHN